MAFKPNRKFKRDYDRLFKKDPIEANTLLLLCELANDKGEVCIKDYTEISELMAARFNDPEEYAL
jgi:hypothetical protein